MKCYVEVYGCTANKSDAHLVEGLIHNHPQHSLVSTVEEADLLIILTCTVISTTEQRMLHRIRCLSNSKKQLVIAGCMASVQKEMLTHLFPDAILVTPRNIHHLFEIIEHKKKSESVHEKAHVLKRYSTLIAPVSIAEGCLFSCDYCITHLARGRLCSYPEADIITAVHDAIDQGCIEIQLTAQDTASYGLDRESSLPQLLKKIIEIKGDYKIRIGMMNPRTAKTIMPDLLPLFQHPRIYSFLHLPLQSGDNTILKNMNRGYTTQEGKEIIKQSRKKMPELTIATDVIVGYPTETDEQFQKTKQLLQDIDPDVVNITRFSARPFTKAKTMNGRIPTEIVKNRSRELTELCQDLIMKRNNTYIGKEMAALALKRGKNHTTLCRTDNYKPVVTDEGVSLGEKVRVHILEATDTHLVGMLK
jgi:MiaB-like tRNA modifying enzyme